MNPCRPDAREKQKHLAQAKRFNTLASRESRRADKLRFHERAMDHLFAILPPLGSKQGKLL